MAEAGLIPALLNVRIDSKNDNIIITYDTEGECLYPVVILRYNCLCDRCLDSTSMDNKICMVDINPDIKATEAKVSFNYSK